MSRRVGAGQDAGQVWGALCDCLSLSAYCPHAADSSMHPASHGLAGSSLSTACLLTTLQPREFHFHRTEGKGWGTAPWSTSGLTSILGSLSTSGTLKPELTYSISLSIYDINNHPCGQGTWKAFASWIEERGRRKGGKVARFNGEEIEINISKHCLT